MSKRGVSLIGIQVKAGYAGATFSALASKGARPGAGTTGHTNIRQLNRDFCIWPLPASILRDFAKIGQNG